MEAFAGLLILGIVSHSRGHQWSAITILNLLMGLALLGWALASAAAGQVYKCPDKSGHIVFSDRPCDRDSKPIDLYPALGNDSATMARKYVERERESQKTREEATAKMREQMEREVAQHIAEGKKRREEAVSRFCGAEGLRQVRIGLTADEVRHCTSDGEPDHINSTETAYGLTEQWVMRRWSDVRYIYFRNGKVSAISR